MRNVPRTNTEQNHDLVYEWNECKQGLNPGKIHAKPDNKSFANQGFQATTWHVEWRHRESSYIALTYQQDSIHPTLLDVILLRM